MPVTYNSINPTPNYALPTPTAKGGGLIPQLWHLIGRAAGANEVSGGYDPSGNYSSEVVAHPTLDRIFNAGQAGDYANLLNTAQGQMMLGQKLGQQRVGDVAQADIATDTNRLQQAADAQSRLAKVQQALGVATQFGVPVDMTGITPTPGMSILSSELAPRNITNQSNVAGKQGQWLDSPEATPSLEQGFAANANKQAFENFGKLPPVTAPLGGTSTALTPLGAISAIGGTQSSVSTSTGAHIDSKTGQLVPQVTTGQSGTTPGSVSVPVDPKVVEAAKALQGTGGVNPAPNPSDPFDIIGQAAASNVFQKDPSEQDIIYRYYLNKFKNR